MPVRATRTLVTSPVLPGPLQPLERLAGNLLWTWHPSIRDLFVSTGLARWEEFSHNPVRMLQSLTHDDFARLEEDGQFLAALKRACDFQDAYVSTPAKCPEGLSEGHVVAYFSLEFALTESLPIYSGGLGVLAGDHLKSASDLALPLIGLGLYYREGYFQQSLSPDGWQMEAYSTVDPAFQPMEIVRRDDGSELRVNVMVTGRNVQVRAWVVNVGRVRLFLIDSNVPENVAEDRDITARLYGGDSEMRIRQEMLLGIGGVRVLREIGFDVGVYHMNEGHSSLLGLERSRIFIKEHGLSLAAARQAVAASTVFTTHTPVAAGIDVFSPDQLSRNLGPEFADAGLSTNTILSIGRLDPSDGNSPLSMAILGLRFSSFRNGVSQLHGDVSRQLWNEAWAGVPQEQVPIGAITNGVHLPTWIAPSLAHHLDRHIGPAWRDDPTNPESWAGLKSAPHAETWAIRNAERGKLVERVRAAKREDNLSRGLPVGEPPLDPNIITIGFARRFAAYKRATLLFRDPARLARIVNHPERPVQILFAGKAHPKDEPAKELIREVVKYTRMPEFAGRIVILEHYDVDLARTFVQGSDIWLNTPTRPLEASGTSGMKAVANGALHCSVLDGWWAEAYEEGLGWPIGHGETVEAPETQAARDAASIYELLENEITRLFYERNEENVPVEWVNRIHGSIASYAPRFNTNRMVQDYSDNAYEPAAAAGARLAANDYAAANAIASLLERAQPAWPQVKVLDVSDETRGGNTLFVRVQVHPGQLAGEDLRVDACHGPSTLDGVLSPANSTPLSLVSRAEEGTCTFEGEVTLTSPGRNGYAIRILPGHPELAWPLDTGLVLWA